MELDLLYRCENVSFSYVLGGQHIKALEDINIDIKKGDFICINGPSGSGKSTFLNLLGMIEPLQNGEILFKNHAISTYSERLKNEFRKYHMGFIFQNFHLMNVLTAYENVEYFLVKQGLSFAERIERVEEALNVVELWEHRHKKPLEMSGGQKQRVAIARALAKKPDVIIADEPTASLDQKIGREIMELLLKMNREQGQSVILASHDPMVIEHSSIKIKLKDGAIL